MTAKTEFKSASVPSGRASRLMNLGSLAGRVAGNLVVEGSRQLIKGERVRMSDLVMTPENLNHLAEKLAKMRGAAMKLGQLLSMDAGTLLPPELAAVLARLQAEGMIMPKTQLLAVLEENWGEDWMDQFEYFSFDPVAAASIGQVHEARTTEGEHLAIKIQFPGVRDSIDSDIDNVLSLLKISGLIPKGLEIDALVDEARRQLKAEADYRAEAEWIGQFNTLLAEYEERDQLLMPSVCTRLSSTDILAMTFVPGERLEAFIGGSPERASEQLGRMLRLFITELLQFQLMQTDPNPANYHVDPDTGRLVLFDFGAVRAFDPGFVVNYRSAIDAAIAEDRTALKTALLELGFFSKGLEVANVEVILDIFILAAEPLRFEGVFDFGASQLSQRIQAKGMSVSRSPDAWHTPPADVLFLHRKMGGLYLMAAKYGARVDVGQIYREVCASVD